MKLKKIPLQELLIFSRFIGMSLKVGRDLKTGLCDFIKTYPEFRLSLFVTDLHSQFGVVGVEVALKQAIKKSPLAELTILLEILSLSLSDHHHVTRFLKDYEVVLYQQIKFQKEIRSQLFVPKLQGLVTIAMVGLFAFGLPQFFPALFPSFTSLGRYDLLISSWAFILLGFLIMMILTKKPLLELQDKVLSIYFFYFLSVFVDSGMDLRSAWIKSEKIIYEEFKRRPLRLPVKMVNSLEDHLPEIWKNLDLSLKNILISVRWALKSGLGLAKFLQTSARHLSDEVLSETDHLIKRVGVLLVFPLTFIIFPAGMFLLLGPLLISLEGGF